MYDCALYMLLYTSPLFSQQGALWQGGPINTSEHPAGDGCV